GRCVGPELVDPAHPRTPTCARRFWTSGARGLPVRGASERGGARGGPRAGAAGGPPGGVPRRGGELWGRFFAPRRARRGRDAAAAGVALGSGTRGVRCRAGGDDRGPVASHDRGRLLAHGGPGDDASDPGRLRG